MSSLLGKLGLPEGSVICRPFIPVRGDQSLIRDVKAWTGRDVSRCCRRHCKVPFSAWGGTSIVSVRVPPRSSSVTLRETLGITAQFFVYCIARV